ncbi:MAG: cation-translocating P-type ATPase [Chloroflexi bacterium]|nr:cation-translocating P-type ATPase [Chloroflexota bacterium]
MIKRQSWHTADTIDVLDQLHVDPEQGLSAHEVEQRLREHGPNELIERGLKSPWLILWEQVTAIMVVVLIIAAVVSLLLGDQLDAIVILAIVVLNAILGFVQEYRAERAMAALKRMAAPLVKVRREGQLQQVSAKEIVPGDILLLEAGDVVSADARVLESVNLRIEEASLTGESIPVEKHSQVLSGAHIPIGDRRNMLHMGTTATYGRGSAVVVETGMATQLGRIAELIQTVVSEPTPLQKRMAQLGKGLAVAAVAIVGVVFFLGLLRGEELEEMFLIAIAMAVAAVPEGLPAVVTITLALGAQRMLRRRALIRKLPAVETLGSVTVICSDKTGTLTENRMTVKILDLAGHTLDLAEALKVGDPVAEAEEEWATPEHTAEALLLAGGALCNDAVLEVNTNGAGGFRAQGDPTERALVVAAARYGLMKPRLESLFPRVAEAPFSSERKRMSTFHEAQQQAQNGAVEARLISLLASDNNQPFVAFTKGATESLLGVCDRVWTHAGVQPLTPDWRQRIEDADDRLAGDGLRVLGVAFRTMHDIPAEGEMEALERDLIFVGLVGMIDPPRPEAKEAVAISRTAGVRPVMITGDHPQTALHIARELDIARDSNILTGRELERMTTEELEARVEQVSVYARVSPEHKLNIVRALQKRGHIVAMTGDGVNDAPALKRADIGVAMGITGTDVAKEAADMVILDDNFATIVRAIEQGRVIYDNVRKFIKYTLTSNAGEIYVMLFGPLLGMPLPLTALQILWINLVTDGLPGLALAVEPAERDTMRRPPYPPKQSIFARGMGRHILWVGLLMGLVSLAVGYWAWITGRPAWQTMVFTTLTLSQMGHVLAIRSDRESLFKIGLLTNKPLLGAVALTFVLQLAVIFWRPLQEIFNTQALTPFELGISLGLSTIVFWAVEIEKRYLRRHR